MMSKTCNLQKYDFILQGHNINTSVLEQQMVAELRELCSMVSTDDLKVWPLTIFLVCFLPHWGEYCSLQFLSQTTPLSWSQTIEGLFELTHRALQGPSTSSLELLPELSRIKDIVPSIAL